MLKKMVVVAGIAITSLSLTGCFGGNPYAEHKDAKWYSAERAFYVANELIGDKFNDERKEIAEELKDYDEVIALRKNDDGTLSVTKKQKDVWKNTYNEGFYYVGELDDNRPDGIGALYKKEYGRKGLIPIYYGEWEEGMYNGYGQLFEIPHNSYMSRLRFEGTFEENKPNGRGIMYDIWGNNHDLTSCKLTYAEFEEDFKHPMGKVKQFVNYVLRFEGEVDEDGDGKGTEYYENGNVKYEGEFKNGSYHGDGVLYDKDGKKIYDGEWERGDYK